jgi:hypothetical protein
MSFCIKLLFNLLWQPHCCQHHLSLPQPSSHSVSHGLQVTTITKILVAGVAFVEDGRLIIVAISIMVLTGITLVRIFTIMVLGLDSLLDRILGNKAIILGALVSGQTREKKNANSTIVLGIERNNAPNYPIIIRKPMLIWCVILNLKILLLLGFLIQVLISM